jgi:hypothetical protein
VEARGKNGWFMKMRVFTVLGAVLVMGILGSNVALAGPITLAKGGPTITLSYFTSNANVHGTVAFSLSSDGTTLIILMTNTSTTGAGVGVITAIGWNTTPNTTINMGASTIPTPWTYGTKGGGVGGFEHRDNVNGIGNGLAAGASVAFALKLSNSLESLVLDDTIMHFQEVYTGQSEKPHGQVPEPSMLLLLGIGIGVASLGYWRKNS